MCGREGRPPRGGRRPPTPGVSVLAAAVRTATSGLLVFLVCAAVLALLGTLSEARVVEAVAVTTAAPAGSRCGRTTVASERRGTVMAAMGRGVRSRDRCCGGGTGILAPTVPNLVALLREGGQVREILRVDHVPDVGGHLAEEQDLHVHRGWLQGVELVHQD